MSAGAVLVGSTIGSGIFRVPSTVAESVGSAPALLAVWIVGAFLALAGALTLAELATMHPRSGGIYVYLREGYGPLAAFLFGWTSLVVIRPAALGAIAMIFAAYLGVFVPLDERGVRIAAAGTILAITLLNMRSVRWGAALENGTTGAKLAALSLLSVLAFALHPGPLLGSTAVAHVPPVSGFAVALVAALWAYDGWADLTFMAGEVRDPGRTLPRALVGGVLVVIATYLTVNVAYLHLLPFERFSSSELVAADAAVVVAGEAGRSLVAALVILSTLGALNGAVMTGPRVFFAMAEDGLMFRPVARVHPRYRTPYVAVALAGGLGIAFVSVRSFEQMAGAFVLGIWPFYALAVGSVILLRRRRPEAERPYRVPGYPLLPIVFLLASVGMLGGVLVSAPGTTLLSFGVILAGIPVFRLWRTFQDHRGR